MTKNEKILVEFSPKELAFICEAFYNYTGRTPKKKKVRILKKHRKFCDKLYTTLAYSLADYGVKVNTNEYFE